MQIMFNNKIKTSNVETNLTPIAVETYGDFVSYIIPDYEILDIIRNLMRLKFEEQNEVNAMQKLDLEWSIRYYDEDENIYFCVKDMLMGAVSEVEAIVYLSPSEFRRNNF